jgi:hypothetical protein
LQWRKLLNLRLNSSDAPRAAGENGLVSFPVAGGAHSKYSRGLIKIYTAEALIGQALRCRKLLKLRLNSFDALRAAGENGLVSFPVAGGAH